LFDVIKRKNNGYNVNRPNISKSGGFKFVETLENNIGRRRIEE